MRLGLGLLIKTQKLKSQQPKSLESLALIGFFWNFCATGVQLGVSSVQKAPLLEYAFFSFFFSVESGSHEQHEADRLILGGASRQIDRGIEVDSIQICTAKQYLR